MTMTFKCKKKNYKKAPGVVHIDNTARPQIIDKSINKRMYNVLSNLKKLVG